MLPERRRKATFSASPGVSSHASRQLRRRMSSPKAPSLLDALIPLLTLIVLLVLCVYLFGSDATGGPTQIVLILGAAVAALVAVRNGHPWPEIQKAIVAGLGTAMGAIMILLMVGALIGAWLTSGTVPCERASTRLNSSHVKTSYAAL